MRLPEAKIKEAIAHPEKLVREEALRYFTGCYSLDTDVMPLAVQSIETYGRKNAFFRVDGLASLAQTEATLDWVIRELHRKGDKSEEPISYSYHLSQILYHADPRLVMPRAQEILQVPTFAVELRPGFQERQKLLSWDADRCWQELERICAEAADEDEPKVDWEHAARVVRALAPQGEKFVNRIVDLLRQQIEDYENDPLVWMEIFLVMLAGEMRLRSAIPMIVAKLHEDGDYLLEESEQALGKIGTDAAAEAVTEGWRASEWDYRLYASNALERIHSDTTVRKCLELLPHEKERDTRTMLAVALLCQFADEGIEPVRELVQKRAYDPMTADLMGQLVAVSTVLGVTFPEYPIWKREAEREREKIDRRIRGELESFNEAPPEPAPAWEPDTFREPKSVPFMRLEKQVGRNDPCPCGSGKKFKKCCMNRGKA